MTEPLTAQEAARLAADTARQNEAQNAEAIRTVLPVVYAAVREAATAQEPLHAATVDLGELGLTPPQQLTLKRTLERDGYQVQLSAATLTVGWQPVAVPRGDVSVTVQGMPGKARLLE